MTFDGAIHTKNTICTTMMYGGDIQFWVSFDICACVVQGGVAQRLKLLNVGFKMNGIWMSSAHFGVLGDGAAHQKFFLYYIYNVPVLTTINSVDFPNIHVYI